MSGQDVGRGTAGVLAGRNRALNTPAGQGAPSIADLVGGVGANLRTRDAALYAPPGMVPPGAPGMAPPMAQPMPAPAAPNPALIPEAPYRNAGGSLYRPQQLINMAQQGVPPPVGQHGGNAPTIADIIRQIRLLQGI